MHLVKFQSGWYWPTITTGEARSEPYSTEDGAREHSVKAAGIIAAAHEHLNGDQRKKVHEIAVEVLATNIEVYMEDLTDGKGISEELLVSNFSERFDKEMFLRLENIDE